MFGRIGVREHGSGLDVGVDGVACHFDRGLFADCRLRQVLQHVGVARFEHWMPNFGYGLCGEPLYVARVVQTLSFKETPRQLSRNRYRSVLHLAIARQGALTFLLT